MNIPNPNEVFPNEYKTSCFIKNVVTAPNITVGDYTYYDDAVDPTGFERNNVLFNYPEFGDHLVIGTEYLTDLNLKLGVNCIGAAVYTEKRIYVSEASAVLHEFGHFLDCAMGFPQEHKDLYALEAASAPMKQRAKSNSLEYFAEFFAYWCSGNTRILEQLKELTPETYAYFDGLSSAWTAGVCD